MWTSPPDCIYHSEYSATEELSIALVLFGYRSKGKILIHIICVFGKRFGKSDKTWNQAILEWLLADSSHILVYCDHSCSRFYPSIPGRKLDKEDEIKERLIQELEGSKEVLPQIHVPVGKTLFDIASAIQEAEEFDERNRKRSTLDVR